MRWTCGTTCKRFWTGPSPARTGHRRCGGCAFPRERALRPALWAFRCVLHTASPYNEPGDFPLNGDAALPPRQPTAEEAFSIAEPVQPDERFCQRCRVGLRKLAMISGVSRTHHGPCGTLWVPSNFPDLHQVTTV